MSTLSRAVVVAALATFGLAEPNKRNPKDGCTKDMDPSQHRMAFWGDSGMAISWNTKAKLSKPTVYWGKDSATEHSVSSDVSTTYPSSSTYNNHVVITGLQPNTRYHYEVQCDHRSYSFTTARSIGDGHSYQFAMVGDLGTMGPDGLGTTVGTGASHPLEPGEPTTIDALHDKKPGLDFVWHGGSTLRGTSRSILWSYRILTCPFSR